MEQKRYSQSHDLRKLGLRSGFWDHLKDVQRQYFSEQDNKWFASEVALCVVCAAE